MSALHGFETREPGSADGRRGGAHGCERGL